MTVKIEITPSAIIPDHLIGEIRSKLAYVDEAIVKADITTAGDRIIIETMSQMDQKYIDALEGKVQRFVTTMVQG